MTACEKTGDRDLRGRRIRRNDAAKKRHSITDSFRGLMAAVLSRALADLEKDRAAIEASPAVRDEAMTWVNGPDCEGYCLTLDVDYTVLRKKAAALYRRFLEKHDKAPEFSDTKKEGLKIHRTPGRAVRKTREEK